MPLNKTQIDKIRQELKETHNPLFFFHDDPDGLCSFLLLYRYIKEGQGVCVKAKPVVDQKFASKVEEIEPDKIFVLDLAIMEEDFVSDRRVRGRPIIWIDHHEPKQLDNVKYFNPRKADPADNTPATHLCYQVTEQDLWIATVGAVADWTIPSYIDEFRKEYPDLIEKMSDDPGDLIFDTTLGKLIKIFSFILKGPTSEVKKCFKILTRIESPYEILKQTSAQGKYIYNKFEKVNKQYELLLNDAVNQVTDDKILLYYYSDAKISFTGDVANELLHKYPDKIIIIAREKDGEMRMSLRNSKDHLPTILNKALVGVQGYGGGHEHACGACVKKEDFDRFLESIKKEVE